MPAAKSDTRCPRDQLIASHLALAENISARFRDSRIDPDDMRGEAQLALVRAATEYTPGAGVPFDRYARILITWHLCRVCEATSAGSLGGIPRSLLRAAKSLRKAREGLLVAGEPRPTLAEIAEAAGLPWETALAAASLPSIALGLSIDHDRPPREDPRADDLWEALDRCTDLEQHMMVRVHGLGDHTQEPLAQIARSLGMSESTARRRLRSGEATVRREMSA